MKTFINYRSPFSLDVNENYANLFIINLPIKNCVRFEYVCLYPSLFLCSHIFFVSMLWNGVRKGTGLQSKVRFIIYLMWFYNDYYCWAKHFCLPAKSSVGSSLPGLSDPRNLERSKLIFLCALSHKTDIIYLFFNLYIYFFSFFCAWKRAW